MILLCSVAAPTIPGVQLHRQRLHIPELEDTFPLDISDTLDPMADDFPFGNDPNA